jgi:hypothetical protein
MQLYRTTILTWEISLAELFARECTNGKEHRLDRCASDDNEFDDGATP